MSIDVDLDLIPWLGMALRWFHLIAGIAWIGASFYFIWLDNNLRPAAGEPKGVAGELWAVHGGGFYHSQKYMVAPDHMPSTLHWFKWEAYTTWITGFLLLALLYYWGAPTYLIDRSKYDFTQGEAVILGLGCIFGGWIVYDLLCKMFGGRPRLFGVIWFLALTAAAWGLTRVFSDRGAFIHVGAIIGTAMVGNVAMVIIPNQRRIVAEMLAGRSPDPALGKQGKQRSVHNNYMTLPVLFIMISNHFPLVTGHPLAWLLLAMLALAGVSIRHFFNLRHFGNIRPGYIVFGVLLFIAVMLLGSSDIGKPKVGEIGRMSYPVDIQPIIQKHCLTCHSATPTHKGFTAPPNGVMYDTPDEVHRYAAKIHERAVASQSMPLGNETGLTPLERAKLGAWIDQGARTR